MFMFENASEGTSFLYDFPRGGFGWQVEKNTPQAIMPVTKLHNMTSTSGSAGREVGVVRQPARWRHWANQTRVELVPRFSSKLPCTAPSGCVLLQGRVTPGVVPDLI